MLASQYILSALIFLIIIKTAQTFLTKKMPLGFTLLWLSIWVVGLIVILDPHLLTSFANLLKIGRGVDLAVYVSIIVIFFFIYQMFVKIIMMEEKITRIVRKEALKDI